MQTDIILIETQTFVQERLKNIESGHGWWHALRVRNMAKTIAQAEGGNEFIIEMAALLHDVEDWKFSNTQKGEVENWLNLKGIDNVIADQILNIIKDLSFKGAGVATPMATIEGKIVQDADRLDAIGAIGVARAFAYGGHMNREMYDPDQRPGEHQSYEEYKTKQSHTINHFYEKLLLLKDRMNTDFAKKIAFDRHLFMEQFLDEFYKEWNGEK